MITTMAYLVNVIVVKRAQLLLLINVEKCQCQNDGKKVCSSINKSDQFALFCV